MHISNLYLKAISSNYTMKLLNLLVKQNTEKKKSSPNQYAKKITLQRKEVTEIIGDELTNDEISEFFYFCLQKSDFLSEWRKMYQNEQNAVDDGDDEDMEPEM